MLSDLVRPQKKPRAARPDARLNHAVIIKGGGGEEEEEVRHF